MKKRVLFLISLLLILQSFSVVYADSLPKPSREFFVYDETNTLTEETKNYIIDINKKLESNTGSQVVVAMVNSLDGLEIEDYAVKLFRHWGIGDKDKNNGVLLLVAKEERQIRIEIGYGLEGALPDGKVGSILDKYVVPSLQEDNYDEGVYNGFSVIVDTICKEYRINIDELQVVETEEAGIIPILVILAIIIFIAVVLPDDGISGGYTGSSFGGSSSGRSYSGGGGRSGGGGVSRGF